MARLIGPDENSRLVYTAVGGNLRSAAGKSAIFYADSAATTLADIRTEGGAAVSGSTLTVDTYSKLPLFQFPDGVDVVYAVVNGGPVTPIYARADDRMDAVDARVTALEAGGAGDALVVHKAGAENITGVKTFTVSPVVPAPSGGTDAAHKTYVDIGDTAVTSAAATDATTKANAAQAAAATDATTKANAAQAAAIAASQPLDSDLTAIAALTPSNDDVVQRKAGAWTNRTPAQVKTDLALVKGDVGLGNVDNTSDLNKPVSTATQAALDLKAPLAGPTFTGTTTADDLTVSDDLTVGDDITLASGSVVTWATDTNLYRGAANKLTTDDTVEALAGFTTTRAAAISAYLALVTGDTVHRFRIDTNGKVEWGPGGVSAVDTNLYRDSANVLKTDDSLVVTGDLTVSGSFKPAQVDAKGDLLAGTADNTVARVAVGADGQVLVADSTQATGVGWVSKFISSQTFLSSGTYNIPTGAKYLYLEGWGGGQGGGSGGVAAAGVAVFGGGGGAAGAGFRRWVAVVGGLGGSLSVTVGLGGAGGAAQATNSSSGNNGVDGGVTTITGLVGQGNTNAPTSGQGGSTASGAGGAAKYCDTNSGAGAASSVTATAGVGGSATSGGFMATGGGAGGGISSGNVAFNGGNGGIPATTGGTQPSGGVVGGAAPANPSDRDPSLPGLGAGGGAAALTGAGQAGAKGSFPGGGGGGGGAARDGQGGSGAGGAGGDGCVRITAFA